jgi:hypothetical protein
MQGGRQATIVVAVTAILSLLMPPMVVISTAAVCLVGLREGSAGGFRVIIGATVATALMGYVLLGTPLVALSYLCVMWLPALLVSLVLRETTQLNKALECLVVLGMLAIAVFYYYIDDPALLWADGIREIVASLSEQQDLSVTPVELQAGLEFWSHYVTGVIAAGTLVSLLLSLLLGRWWQGLLYNPGGFDEEFRSLRLLPRDAVAFIVLSGLAFLLDGQVSELFWNLDIQVLLLFLMVGVSVVHVAIKNKGGSRFLIFGFYVAIFLVPHLMLPLVVIGLSDVWMNWRQRFVTKA